MTRNRVSPLDTGCEPCGSEVGCRQLFHSHPITCGRPMNDLFGSLDPYGLSQEELASGAILLRGKALPSQDSLFAEIEMITNKAPFRNMVTPGGYVMSVAMTNCGSVGWVTDRSGYRYDRMDPESGRPRPTLPDCSLMLAISAAAEAGYLDFVPDAASSTVMHLALACRFIRIRTNAI